MAKLKVAKPTRQDFDICHRFNSVMAQLTDNRMYRCNDEADWQEWDEDDEDYKVLSQIRDEYCTYADKQKDDLDNDDHQQIMWRYVKWFFNHHPSAFGRVLMCAEIAMDNAFDNSDDVTTIEWNKRCSEALDMWDEKQKPSFVFGGAELSDWDYDDDDNEMPKVYEIYGSFYGNSFSARIRTEGLTYIPLDFASIESEGDIHESLCEKLQDMTQAEPIRNLCKTTWDQWHNDNPYDYLGFKK